MGTEPVYNVENVDFSRNYVRWSRILISLNMVFVKMLLKEYAEYYEIIEVLFNYLYDRGNSVVTEWLSTIGGKWFRSWVRITNLGGWVFYELPIIISITINESSINTQNILLFQDFSSLEYMYVFNNHTDGYYHQVLLKKYTCTHLPCWRRRE